MNCEGMCQNLQKSEIDDNYSLNRNMNPSRPAAKRFLVELREAAAEYVLVALLHFLLASGEGRERRRKAVQR